MSRRLRRKAVKNLVKRMIQGVQEKEDYTLQKSDIKLAKKLLERKGIIL